MNFSKLFDTLDVNTMPSTRSECKKGKLKQIVPLFLGKYARRLSLETGFEEWPTYWPKVGGGGATQSGEGSDSCSGRKESPLRHL